MMVYKNIIIYYFSGTGNSKNVATWLFQVAHENAIDCQLLNIAQINRVSIDQPDPNALIVFVSPIHGFNYPPVMLHFIFRFPKGNNKVVFMNTRAGMLIGKWITPGLTGFAFFLSAIILKIKGYSIQAMFPADMPSNWISLHPGLNERTVKYLHEKNKEKVRLFSQKILGGKLVFNCLKEAIQDVVVSPVSLGYYFVGRFLFAKTFYASKDCNNCDICINGCPVKAIKKVDNRPYWTFNCESCMKCMGNCPKRAIETAHGFILVVSVLYSLVVSTLFYIAFKHFFFDLKDTMAGSVIGTIIYLGLIGSSYRLVHYCMRFKFVERLMVYTSLTKFKFWGRRYKALKEV